MAFDNTAKPNERLDVLDGLRGIAALMVVLFHFMARWTEQMHVQSLYPYGDIFLEWFPPLRYFGVIGVQLFFLISGFVIILTLQRCSGILDFAGRRFARLWPTMLVCATLTTLLVNGTGIHARFLGTAYWEVQPLEYFASIFFIDPGLIGRYTGIENLRWVDGVYWTLWSEVRFYFVIAMVFWLTPRRFFLLAWLLIQAASTSVGLLNDLSLAPQWPLLVSLLLQPGLLAWFTLGICGYYVWRGKTPRIVILIALLAIIDLLTQRVVSVGSGVSEDALTWIGVYAAIVIPFILFLTRSRLLTPLTSPLFVTIGLASYPLYMFHERAGIVATTYMTDWGIPPLIAMVAAIAGLVWFAILMSRWLENPAKSLILKFWKPLSIAVQARANFLKFSSK
ncbi:MAG: acyltransferase [Henriciella sp.]